MASNIKDKGRKEVDPVTSKTKEGNRFTTRISFDENSKKGGWHRREKETHATVHTNEGDIIYSFTIISDETPEWRMTPVEKMEMMEKGINKSDLEKLKAKTNLDYDKLSGILSTARATLIKKKGKEVFSRPLSERIVSIADIYSYGFEVFDDEQKFNEWISSPLHALGGKRPLDLLDNQFGREEIKNLIGRIDYGVYS